MQKGPGVLGAIVVVVNVYVILVKYGGVRSACLGGLVDDAGHIRATGRQHRRYPVAATFFRHGVPVGRHIPTSRIPGKEQALQPTPKEDGSIIIVVATDAPLTPDQCKRLARRAGLGLGRTGGLAFDGSGDIFIAFSTANRLGSNAGGGPREHTVRTLSHGCMDPLFRATVEATHEAIVNALCAATDTDGILGRRMYALPLDEVRGIMRRYESL